MPSHETFSPWPEAFPTPSREKHYPHYPAWHVRTPHPVLDFFVCSRGSGWRLPLRAEDEIEVFGKDHQLVATLSARIVAALLAHHLDALAMQAELRAELADTRRPPVTAMPRPRMKDRVSFDDTQRATFRARRKARKR